jgi:hypothetical protein
VIARGGEFVDGASVVLSMVGVGMSRRERNCGHIRVVLTTGSVQVN